MSGECLSIEEIPPEQKTPKFPPRPTALPPPLVRNDMGDTIRTRFWDFRDAGLKAYLAIATSLPTRNPTLAPRNDNVF